MSKPLSYYSLDYQYELIQDITQTWGDNLQDLPQGDRYWLIEMLAEHYFLEFSPQATEAGRECSQRLDELDQREQDCLLLAIGNKGRNQPLGYWGMPPESVLENSLVVDISETWGESLERLEEGDQMFLITKLATKIWCRDFEGHLEHLEECFDVRDRLDELPEHQIGCLINALINY